MSVSTGRTRALSLPGAASLSLRARLLALLCVAALLPMTVIGVLGSRTAAATLTEEREAELSEVASEISATADRILAERYGDTQAFARSEAARSMDPGRISAWMDTAMEVYAPAYRMMAVADRRGRLVAARAVDREGRPLPTVADGAGLDVTDQGWFKAAVGGRIADGETFVEDVRPDGLLARLGAGEGDNRTVGFTVPVKDPRGRVIGVWTSRFDFRVVQDLADRLEGALRDRGLTSARLLLLSTEGVVLHASDGRPAAGTKLDDSPILEVVLRPGAAGATETDAPDGGEGTVVLGYHRSTGEGAFGGLGWTVLASEDLAEATRPAADLVRRTILVGLVIAAVMVALALLISAAIMRRLRAYSAFAGRVAGGDLTARVATDGAPELGELSGHLNDMAANLRHLSTEVKGAPTASARPPPRSWPPSASRARA